MRLVAMANERQVASLAYSPTGGKLALLANEGRSVWVWDLEREQPRLLMQQKRPHSFQSLAFTPGGDWLAVVSCNQVGLYRVDGNGTRLVHRLSQHVGHCLTFSADGKRLLSAGSGYYMAWVWDVEGCQTVASLPLPPTVHRAWATSPDGRTIVVSGAALTTSGATYLGSVWDVPTGQKLATFATGHQVLAAAFAPGGDLLAVSSRRGLFLFDVGPVRQRDEGQTPVGDPRLPREPLTRLVYATPPARALAFSPDGRLLFGGGQDRVVHVWDVPSLRERGAWAWEIGSVQSLAVAADGLTAAAGGTLGRAVVWDLDV
jgi:WD40 repeat protein